MAKDAVEKQTVILVFYEEDEPHLPKRDKKQFFEFFSVAYIA